VGQVVKTISFLMLFTIKLVQLIGSSNSSSLAIKVETLSKIDSKVETLSKIDSKSSLIILIYFITL